MALVSARVGTARVGTARLQSSEQAFGHGFVDHLPATSVRRLCLTKKYRQCLRQRKQPFAGIRQPAFYPIQWLRTGQQIEYRVGIGVACRVDNTSLLPYTKVLATMHPGWLIGWLLWCCNLQPITRASKPQEFVAASVGWT